MSPTPAQYSLRAAVPKDRDLIKRFILTPVYTHRHLDWRESLEWLGRQPFWILEKNGVIEAVLSCIAEPDDVAWVRLFAADSRMSPSWVWNILFERVYTWLAEQPVRPIIATLGLQDWFEDMLIANGFQKYQDIIVLSYENAAPPPPPADPSLSLAPMQREDIPRVTQVDNLAFEPVWRLSLEDLTRAYDRSNFKTVIKLDGEIVGYQMSSVNGFTAHLARLAVDPRCQRRRIGYRLLQEVLHHFLDELDVWGVTLNTQDNNHASLALYKKAGFHLTGESFPVYVYPYRDA
jgi:[ribosomal protein S18]-alanine N-acetyltransferase